MTKRPGCLRMAIAAGLVLAGWTGRPAGAGGPPADRFEPNEAVEVIEVRVDVGSDGADLEEPMALDLGLGFPFWLHPVGRGEGSTAPFGAVPQATTARRVVAAGSHAMFTFRIQGEPGQDVLQTTPQLLAGVQVSDIACVGFTGLGAANWTLDGYEVTVNGKPLAAAEAVHVRAQDLQASARFRLAELGLEMAPQQETLAPLVALVRTHLASDAERVQAEQLARELKPLLAEKLRLEKQIAGQYPWMVHADFAPVGRSGSLVASAKVTVVTHLHSGADTANHVYFRTGGHKYVLHPQDGLLSGKAGPLEFELELTAGPLTPGDFRGNALGMLAHGSPYGQAPDRWHPQRLLVEIDGRIVYDSDEAPLDHRSLEAIRLIPPAHFDDNGAPVSDALVSRETYVWEAGRGQGLDETTGLALDLPEATAAAYPDPESELEETTDSGVAVADNVADASDAGYVDPGFSDGCGLFPGEEYPDGWSDAGAGGVGWWGGGWGDPWGGDEGDAWSGEGAWGDDFFGDGGLDEEIDPEAAGEPFQVVDVDITHGWRTTDEFTVHWNVLGDETAIDYYNVYLLPVTPHAAENPIGLPILTLGEHLPPGTNQVSAAGPGAAWDAHAGLFLAPQVVVVPLDPADTPHERIGPATAILPSTQGLQLRPEHWLWFQHSHPPGGPILMPIDPDGEPPGDNTAVWRAGACEGRAILFSDHEPGAWNVGVRRSLEDGSILTKFFQPALAPGRHRVIAHLGFLGGEGVSNQVHVIMQCELWGAVGGHTHYEIESEVITTPGDPMPMALLQQVVDTADVLPFLPYELEIRFHVQGAHEDNDGRPCLFGVRLAREP